MDKQLTKPLPFWHLLLYFFMIGFTFVSTPKTGSTYVLYARVIQAFELFFCLILFVQNFRQGIRFNRYNTFINLWWLTYSIIIYLFALTPMGLSPLFRWMNVIIFLLLGNCYWKDNMQESVRYMAIVFSFFIYLNALLLVIYPDGIWVDQEWVGRGDARRYLFGNYNQTGFVCLLGIMLQSIYSFTTKKGFFNLFCLIVISLISVIYVGSMTSAVCLSALTCGIIFKRSITRNMRLILLLFVVVYILFFTFIIWNGNSIDEISLATRFIEGALSKDTTFSNRTEIWANAVNKIKESPIIGFGVQNVEWNDKYLGGSGPHNLWLMLLLQGGYILCFSFMYITFHIIKVAVKEANIVTTITTMGLLILLVMSQFEIYNFIQIFVLLQIVYYSPNLVNKESDKELTSTEESTN